MTGEKLCFAALFVAEALTAWLYIEYLFERKKSARVLISSFAIGYALLFGVSMLDNTTANAASFFVVNYTLARLDYECSKKNAVLHTAYLTFVMVGAEILVALLISAFGFEFSAYTYDFGVMVALIILSKFLYLVFASIGSRVFAPHKRERQDPHLMVLFCVLPLVSAGIAVFVVFLGMTSGFSEVAMVMTLLIVITLMVVNLIVLVLYNYLQKADEEYLALQLSIQKEQADTAYYQALKEQHENERILVHDIRKHLTAIEAMAKQQNVSEIESYISELNTTLVLGDSARLCSNPILNLLLLRFRDDCKESVVTFHCDVRENTLSSLDASSITALFGNLLSNALDAATDSEEKQVELSVVRNDLQSAVVISVVNSCDQEPISDGHGGFRTKKENKGKHGVGLRSIARVVKKHQGMSMMYYDAQRKQFHSIIQFPALVACCPEK